MSFKENDVVSLGHIDGYENYHGVKATIAEARDGGVLLLKMSSPVDGDDFFMCMTYEVNHV